MTTKIRHTDAVAIVDISGRVVLGEECTSLGKLLSDLIGKGHNRILLNLADVDRIDSAGLAHILRGMMSARKCEGDLKLLNPTTDLQAVMHITRLLSALEISFDEVAAVKSFAKSASAAP